ncbi:LOW QUALITY PROTEIN: hypothetical protein PNEG_04332 [Pneumocystis murina B123]|uniref:Uncharacterized protein n=1 Tax=Pneumocystis murina (strain B123) TaxID=1069680 RepID=A0A0W4ZWW9_PNEMU|nr:LOW QUALITY PROTEIN: hypothetical protein PNEG_04332 [Pneumocystis murina B123]KTW32856.1 LOW QUALITY PROTEIN: hypothetical protein PNEG_04332 [Pneumocystis murina B123]
MFYEMLLLLLFKYTVAAYVIFENISWIVRRIIFVVIDKNNSKILLRSVVLDFMYLKTILIMKNYIAMSNKN